MDVISGVASLSQLAAYASSAWKVFARLYAELNGGPTVWQEYKSNLKHLLEIIERVSFCACQQERLGALDQLTAIIRELSEIAHKAQDLIIRAKRPGVLGICWSSIGVTDRLNRTFESIEAKREILLFILSQQSLSELSYLRAGISRIQTQLDTVTLSQSSDSDIEGVQSLEVITTSKRHGNTVAHNNGSGAIFQRRVRNSIISKTTTDGDRSAVYAANSGDFNSETWMKQLKITEIYAWKHGEEKASEEEKTEASPAQPPQKNSLISGNLVRRLNKK